MTDVPLPPAAVPAGERLGLASIKSEIAGGNLQRGDKNLRTTRWEPHCRSSACRAGRQSSFYTRPYSGEPFAHCALAFVFTGTALR